MLGFSGLAQLPLAGVTNTVPPGDRISDLPAETATASTDLIEIETATPSSVNMTLANLLQARPVRGQYSTASTTVFEEGVLYAAAGDQASGANTTETTA